MHESFVLSRSAFCVCVICAKHSDRPRPFLMNEKYRQYKVNVLNFAKFNADTAILEFIFCIYVRVNRQTGRILVNLTNQFPRALVFISIMNDLIN